MTMTPAVPPIPSPPPRPAAARLPAGGVGRPPAELDTLHARFGARVAGALNERAAAVPHDVGERLRVAREGALVRARQARAAAVAAGRVAAVGVRNGTTAVLGGQPGARWWQRALGAVPVLALLGGLWAIDHFQALEQVRDAAEIDARLLADDLPPQAYSDPGFAEFLKRDPRP
jgi:hypothetical protein